jgi:hypothetical protein
MFERVRRTALSRWLWLLVLLGWTWSACGGIDEAGAPRVVVLPAELSFAEVAVGSQQTLTLTIRNEGNAVLQVRGLQAQTNTGFITFSGATSFDVEARDETTLAVNYEPTDPSLTTGRLAFSTNDPSRPDVQVPILVQRSEPNLIVSPATTEFGIVAEGTRTTQPVILQNIGSAPLILCEIRLEGSPDFSTNATTVIDGRRGSAARAVLQPQGAAGGTDTLAIEIDYAPPAPGTDQAILIVRYDGLGFEENACAEGNIQSRTYPVSGEAGSPLLQVTPNPVSFGEVPIAVRRRTDVTIENVGNLDLRVDRVSIDRNRTSPVFALENTGGIPATLAPGESVVVSVFYQPEQAVPSVGALVIDFTELQGESTSAEVLLSGIGSEASCPVAVAAGFVRPDPQNRRGTEVDWVLPLQTLVLDGSGSFDPDGGPIVDYSWEVVSTPPGAVQGLRPFDLEPSNPAFAQFDILVAGAYEFELRVFDETGFESCTPAIVRAVARPQQTIAIELLWDNPLDPDQTDDVGSDMDLHFLKMPNPWFHPRFDTYFANPSPDWNPEQPSLDIDDTDGAGPETITLDDPVDGQCYAIGVHYFREQYGAAEVTINIYIDGVRRDEIKATLERTDDFFDAARIHFPSREIYRVEEIFRDFDPADQVVPGITDEMRRNNHCTSL